MKKIAHYFNRRKLLCILLGIYIVLCIFSLIYIHFNGQQLVTAGSPIAKITQKLGLGEPVPAPSSNSSKTNGKATNDDDKGNNPSLYHSAPNSSTSSSSDDLVDIVAFYSDTQEDTDEEDINHQRVVNYILASGANPVFHAGDIMEDGTQNSLDRFSTITSTLRSNRAFYAAPGNNDRKIDDSNTISSLWLSYFNFPNNERWYSLNLGTLHLIVLDSAFASLAPGSSQYNWLSSDLQSQAAQSRIIGVMFHHPTVYDTIAPLLSENHVDFTIAGHVHTYSHSVSNGINNFTLSGQPSVGYILARVYSQNVLISAYNSNNGLIEMIDFANR